MPDLDVALRLRADSSGLVGEVRLSQRELRRLTREAERTGTASRALDRTGDASGRAGRQALQASDRFRSLGRSVTGAGRSALRANLGWSRLGRSMEATQRRATALRLVMVALATGVGARVGSSFLRAASDAQELRSQFEAVFRGLSTEAREWADVQAAAVGRSSLDLQQYLATLQDTFVPLGFAREQAFEFSRTLTQLGIDLASFKNAAEPETIDLLTSALVGNHEAVRRFGVVITEASLKQELMTAGIAGGVTAATEQQKVLARLRILLRSTADAQGDAARTAGQHANQVRALSGDYRDLQVSLGTALIPTAQTAIALLREGLGTLGDEFDADGVGLEIERSFRRLLLGAAATADALVEPFDAVRSVGSELIDGFNALPPWVQELGIVGAILFGTRGRVAIAGLAGAAALVRRAIGEADSAADQAIADLLGQRRLQQARLSTGNALGMDVSRAAQELNDTDLALYSQLQSVITSTDRISAETASALREAGVAVREGYIDAAAEIGDGRIRLLEQLQADALPSELRRINAAIDTLRSGRAGTLRTGAQPAAGAVANPFTQGSLFGRGAGGGDLAARLEELFRRIDQRGGRPAAPRTTLPIPDIPTGAVGDTSEVTGAIAAAQSSQLRRFITEVSKAFQEAQQAHQDAIAAITDAELELATPYERAVQAARAWRDETLAGLDQTAAGYDDWAARIEAVYEERINRAARDAADEQLRQSRRWQDGAARAFLDYERAATDAGQNAEDAISSGLRSMEDAFVSFASGAKADFSDLVDSIIADLARIVVREQITGPLSGSLGDLFGGLFGGGGNSSFLPDFFHGGGRAGDGRRSRRSGVPRLAFAAAPRFHNGLLPGLRAGEMPAILRVGETVRTAEQERDLARGGSVSIRFDNRGTPQREVSRQVRFDPRGLVIDIIVDDVVNGGPIRSAFERSVGGAGVSQ